MWLKNISMESMNSETLRLLDLLKEDVEGLYVNTDWLSKLTIKGRVKEVLDQDLLNICNMFNRITEYQTWYNSIKVQYELEKDRELELEAELIKVREERDKLIEMINKYQTSSLIEEFNNSSREILGLLSNNIKSISVSESMRSRVNSPTYISGLDTELLVKDYISSDYKLTSDIVSKYNEMYGITYHGLRLRLKKSGVWKANQE